MQNIHSSIIALVKKYCDYMKRFVFGVFCLFKIDVFDLICYSKKVEKGYYGSEYFKGYSSTKKY